MVKTFFAGIILGIVAAFAVLHLQPAVDQFREPSIISVMPNGGNTEEFRINVPMDRIMVGAQGRSDPLPPGMEWPDDPLFSGMQSELFKVRNSRDTIIGVAARLAANDETAGNVIEWVLHMPARGSVFIRMQPEAASGSRRIGTISSGTREFSRLIGAMSERWIADTSEPGDTPAGRIELVMQFVAEEDLSETEGLVPVDEASQ